MSKMKRSSQSSKNSSAAIKEVLAAKELPAVLLVTAPDSIRLRRVEEAIREKLAMNGSQVSHLRGDSLSAEILARLADDRSTLSLFSGPRLFVLSQIDKVPQGLQKQLAAILATDTPGTVFLCCGASLPASNPITQSVEKHGTHIAFAELGGEELTAWTAKEFKRNGIEAAPATVVEHIIEFAERSPDRIAQLVSHLALYLDGEPPGEQTIAALFPSVPVAGEFELIDSIIGGSPSRTELMFESLVRAGKSPFMLIGMISKIFGNYHQIANLLERQVAPAAIRDQLKMTPWVFNKSVDAARRLKPRDLERHLHAIVRADSRLKNKSLGTEAIFSELFMALRPATRERHA